MTGYSGASIGRKASGGAVVGFAVYLGVAVMLSACGENASKARASATMAAASAPAAIIAVARGRIEVQGGLLDLMAPQDGVVDSVAVQEGASVKRGQLLLQLASDQSRLDQAMAQAELKLARARQQAQVDRLPALRHTAERMAEAVVAQAVDEQRSDDAQQALRVLESGMKVAEAETALAEQKVSQLQSLAHRLTVVAPQDASVVRMNVQPGGRVAAQGGKPLMVLLPTKALQLRAEVNETFVPLITVGMRASVHLDGDAPGAGRTGLPGARVVRISPLFGSGRLDDEAQARGNVRVVDCFLEFDQAPSLRVGQAVRVEFHP